MCQLGSRRILNDRIASQEVIFPLDPENFAKVLRGTVGVICLMYHNVLKSQGVTFRRGSPRGHGRPVKGPLRKQTQELPTLLYIRVVMVHSRANITILCFSEFKSKAEFGVGNHLAEVCCYCEGLRGRKNVMLQNPASV